MLKQFLLVALVSLVPLTASAEPIVENIGVRVGGYGFREATTASDQEKSGTGWQACRMNGLGVFANKSLYKNYFVEGGFDTYFTQTFPTSESMGSYDTPIDRSSALLSVALGARLPTGSRISPYIQVGIGMGRFRVPTLRNVALSSPYGHDGSVDSLEAFIRIYEAGGRNVENGVNRGDGRQSPHRSRDLKSSTLSDAERDALIAFLESLTDRRFQTAEEHSDPW